MNLSEMLETRAGDYLKNGFHDEQGETFEGINGLHSLGMAYRLREENADPDQLKRLVDELEAIAMKQDQSIYDNPKQKMDPAIINVIQQLAKKNSSPVIQELFDAAQPWIKNWSGYAAFVLHLHRILSQYVLIRSIPENEE
jgi:hypothetical protein